VATIGLARDDQFPPFELREEVEPALVEGHKVISCLDTALDFLSIAEGVANVAGLVEISGRGGVDERRKREKEGLTISWREHSKSRD
jgi:hypothetical protein